MQRVFLPGLILSPNFNESCQIWQETNSSANTHLAFLSKFQFVPSVSEDACFSLQKSYVSNISDPTRANLRPERKEKQLCFKARRSRCKLEELAEIFARKESSSYFAPVKLEH